MAGTDRPNRPLEAAEEVSPLVGLLAAWLNVQVEATDADGAARLGVWTYRLARRLPDYAVGIHVARDGPDGLLGANLRGVAWDAEGLRRLMRDLDANYDRLIAAIANPSVEYQERRRRARYREALRAGLVGLRLRMRQDDER